MKRLTLLAVSVVLALALVAGGTATSAPSVSSGDATADAAKKKKKKCGKKGKKKGNGKSRGEQRREEKLGNRKDEYLDRIEEKFNRGPGASSAKKKKCGKKGKKKK